MNIAYNSDGFSKFYSLNRHHWDEFYKSERYIMKRYMDVMSKPFSILDVGCGCGGLGEALSEKYHLSMYHGIDINLPNIETARNTLSLDCPFELTHGDIAEMNEVEKYDFVISFSCIDFNIEVEKMLLSCWTKVREGGRLILSVRLTDKPGVNDIQKSYQPIGVNANVEEMANYVVFNVKDFMETITKLPGLGGVDAYGYWGLPSATAHTPYERLCFSVAGLQKKINEKEPRVMLDLPLDLLI